MEDLTKIGLGFVLGLLSGCFISYRSHYYAMIRDEWKAGTQIRGLLNKLLEKHRYSTKRGEQGFLEFFRYANNTSNENEKSTVDRLDNAVNEFKDFLVPLDQNIFEQKWARARHEIRRLGGWCKNSPSMPNSSVKINDKEMSHEEFKNTIKSGFDEVGLLLAEMKVFTLKIRLKPWWKCAMPLIKKS